VIIPMIIWGAGSYPPADFLLPLAAFSGDQQK
jgi:hypothetical protein